MGIQNSCYFCLFRQRVNFFDKHIKVPCQYMYSFLHVPRNAPSESNSPQYEGTRPCLLSSVCPSFLIVRLNSSRAPGCCFQKVLFVFVPGARQRKLLFCIWEKINRCYSFACQESPDSTTTIIMDLYFH